MRLLTRRIYRAFPELDRFPDEACERFVRAARRGLAAKVVHASCVLIVSLLAGIGASFAFFRSIRFFDRWGDSLAFESVWLTLGLIAWMLVLGCIPVLMGLAARDRLLRRRVGQVLHSRGSCNVCRYSLLGLPVGDDLKVACPECGSVVTVDASMAELAEGAGGAKRFAPAAPNEHIPPPLFSRRTWRRIFIGVMALVVVPLVLGLISWGAFEWWLRAQARDAADLIASINAQAQRDAESLSPEEQELNTQVSLRLVEAIEKIHEGDRRAIAGQEAQLGAGATLVVEPPFFFLGLHPDFDYAPEQNSGVSERLAIMPMWHDEYEHADVFLAIDAAATQASIGAAQGISSIRIWNGAGIQDLSPITQAISLRLFLAAARGEHDTFDATLQAAARLEPFLMDSLGTRGFMRDPTLSRVIDRAMIHVLAAPPSPAWVESIDRAQAIRTAPATSEAMDASRAFFLSQAAAAYTNPLAVRKAYLDEARNWASQGTWSQPTYGRLGTLNEVVGMINASHRVYRTHADQMPWERTGVVPVQTPLIMASWYHTVTFQILSARDERVLHARGISAMIAIERFRHSRGEYPATLDALVPEFMPEVPRDIWADRPLSYRRFGPGEDAAGRGYVLYSVGPDAVDDHGHRLSLKTPQQYVFWLGRMQTLGATPPSTKADYILNPPPAPNPWN